MIPTSVAYHKPQTIEEALNLLNSLGDEAKLLAGGHSLIPVMKLRLNSPEHLIDIGKIKEMIGVFENDDYIAIGASTTHNDIANMPLIKERYPMISEAGGMIGDVQVRNFGTIGGSIAHADPAADWPGVLLAADASILVQNKEGKNIIKAQDFFQGLFMTQLEETDIITHILLPKEAKKSTYQKFVQPASRFAIVGCAAALNMDSDTVKDAAIAFNGVSAKPFRDSAVENALNGKALTQENIEAAATLAAEGVSILSDHYASEKYRKHLAKVYTKRALMALQ